MNRKILSAGFRRKTVSLMLCLCMVISMFSGIGFVCFNETFAVNDPSMISPTEGVDRQADASTMDSYLNMLDFSENTRYAGRLWADKSVFAYDEKDLGDQSKNWDGRTLTLDEKTDGVKAAIPLNTDFLHVYSALGSTLEIREAVFPPIDLVIIIDMSGSMAQDVVDNTYHGYNNQTNKDLTIDHSRIQQTLYAVNDTIDYLMGLNDENRVAVVAYGTTAKTLMELGHYTTTNTVTELAKNNEPEKKHKAYLTAENFTSYYHNGNAGIGSSNGTTSSGAYTIHVTATKDKTKSINTYVRNDYGAYTTGAGAVANNPDLIGFHTDMQAGIYQGFEELYKNYNDVKDVTYSYSTKDGEKVIPRTPMAFVMTDGGSNYALKANGSVTGNEWKKLNVLSNVNDWNKNSPRYHDPRYTKYRIETTSLSGASVILDILLTASYMKSKVYNKYIELLDKCENLSKDDRENVSFPIQTVSVDTPDTNWQKPRVYATMDPENFFTKGYTDSSWGNRSNDISEAYDMWEQWQKTADGGTLNIKCSRDYPTGSTLAIKKLPAGKDENGVSNEDVINNINYNDNFYDTAANVLTELFKGFIENISEPTFVPVNGQNDLDTENAITYMDPVGKYMEIKDVNSFVLFGEKHDVTRAAVYSWKFNDDYMIQEGRKGQGFEDGWYRKRTDGTIEKSSSDRNWEDGWEYHVSSSTAVKFTPSIKDIAIEDPPDKIKNTTYTFYHLSGSEDNTKLYINPAYGTSVPVNVNYDKETQKHLDSPGVYSLADLRIWVEDTEDYVDSSFEQSGSESDKNFDEALYINLPVNMLPLKKIVFTENADGSYTYIHNEEINERSYLGAFPFRVFYSVGLESKLRTADGSVDLTGKVSTEYINQNKVTNEAAEEARGVGIGNVEFFSNWYAPEHRYADYATTATDYTYGSPMVTFSPNDTNRYYIFQKNISLYNAAYVWVPTKDLSAAERSNPIYADILDRYGGLWKKVKLIEDPTDGQDDEVQVSTPADFGGKLICQDLEPDKLTATDDNEARQQNQQLMWDALGQQNISPGILTGGEIILLKSQRIEAAAKSEDESATNSIASGSYYYIPIQYYELEGNSATPIFYVVARKGSEFGSGYASKDIKHGQMLCWHDLTGQYSDYPFLSPEDTGDLSQGKDYIGAPLDENGWYENCDINNPNDLPSVKPNKDGKWIKENGGEWVLSAKIGGLRVGDLAQCMLSKGGSYSNYPQEYILQRFPDSTDKTWMYCANNYTRTANNYYLPSISSNSSNGNNDIIVNIYLGNNGRLMVMDTSVMVTKRVEKYADFLSAYPKKEFDFQIYIEGYEGAYSAVVMRYNASSDTWQRQLHYIDLELNGSLFLQTTDGSLAMVDSKGHRVLQSVTTNEDGEYTYRYADAWTDSDGTIHNAEDEYDAKDDGGPYFVYIGSNSASESIEHKIPTTAMRVFHNELVDDDESISKEDVVAYLVDADGNETEYDPSGEWNPEDTASGVLKFYAKKVWLFNVDQYNSFTARAIEEIDKNEDKKGLFQILKVFMNIINDKPDVIHNAPDFEDSGSLLSLDEFELLTVDPNALNNEITVSSPYRTSSTYWTQTVCFGYKSDATVVTGSDGSSQIQGTQLQLSDLYIPDPTAAKVKNTAEIKLQHNYGLLFTSMNSGTQYVLAEKNTDAVSHYNFMRVEHIRQQSAGLYKADDPSDGTYYPLGESYAVTGDTGEKVEAGHFVNGFVPDVLIVQKELTGEHGTAVYPSDKNVDFSYDVIFERPQSTEDNHRYYTIDLYYWKGPTEKLSEAPDPFDMEALQKAKDNGTLQPISPDKEHKYHYTLKADESIVFYGLEIASKYTLTEQKHELYPSKGDIYTATGTVEYSGDLDPWYSTANKIKFNNLKTGNRLVIAKTLENSNMDEKELEKEFSFTVEIIPPDGNNNILSYLNVIRTDASGKIIDDSIVWDAEQTGKPITGHFRLRHGEKLAIAGLPMNTVYTVYEDWDDNFRLQRVIDEDGEKYESLVRGEQGEASYAKGVIPENADGYMEFINSRKVEIPFTGGIGRTQYCVLGALLTFLPLTIFLFYRRRRLII